MKTTIIASIVIVALSGCATSPDQVSPTYVTPYAYKDLDCSEIEVEFNKVANEVKLMTIKQDSNYSRDTAAVVVGAVIFWPALFFLAGEDNSAELANLKGQYEAVEGIAEKNKCDFLPAYYAAIKAEKVRLKAIEDEKKYDVENNRNDSLKESMM